MEPSTTEKTITDLWVSKLKRIVAILYLSLECEGRSHGFYYDSNNFYREFNVSLKHENNLPMNNPVKLSMILLFVLSSVLPIMGYSVIFWYAKI